MRGGRRWLGRAVRAAALSLALLASPAVAQQDEKPWQDPAINWAQPAKPWWQWLAAGLFAVAILAIAFKNPHRSHLD